jgi:hypothetical protein
MYLHQYGQEGVQGAPLHPLAVRLQLPRRVRRLLLLRGCGESGIFLILINIEHTFFKNIV